LRCLREGRCRPGGEAGSSIKLAHTFLSVAVRYYSRHILGDAAPNTPALLLQALVGERPVPDRRTMAKMALKSKAKKIARSLVPPILLPRPKKPPIPGLREMFVESVKQHLLADTRLLASRSQQLPPLADHEQMFE